MRTLKEHILEKLVVNKNYHSDDVDFEDKNIDDLFLIRFYPNEKTMFFDIVTNLSIKLKVNKPDHKIYDVSGDFVTGNEEYIHFACTYEQPGILIRPATDNIKWVDILLPPKYIDNFKEFINSFYDDIKYSVKEVFNMLDIMECIYSDNISDKTKSGKYSLEIFEDDFDRIQNYLKTI